jgi:hypothetical protein
VLVLGLGLAIVIVLAIVNVLAIVIVLARHRARAFRAVVRMRWLAFDHSPKHRYDKLLAFLGLAGIYPLSSNQRIEASRTLERRASSDAPSSAFLSRCALLEGFTGRREVRKEIL